MYSISVPDEKHKYHVGELAKMFLPEDAFCIYVGQPDAELVIGAGGDYNDSKRRAYAFFRKITGKDLDWGILTGVRPGKLYNELKARGEDPGTVLKQTYYVSDEKIALLRRVSESQQTVKRSPDPKAIGLYVGIPFCPTRCQYCSFTSNPYQRDASDAYLAALSREMEAVRKLMDRQGQTAESIYVGGGTPTSLEVDQLRLFLNRVRDLFVTDSTVEFTVEGGRPETITAEKLTVIQEAGAGRISINPQSMKQRTLDLIGRKHSPQQIREAFALAQQAGIGIVNADLITGLPAETPEDFRDSLSEVIALGPENVTVHTLAVKKASRMIEEDPRIALRQADNVRQMLQDADRMLTEAGFEPYYMYRQKHMAGNFENVGWCRPGTASLYNIRIMEEDQTIVAMGAGAISKVYFPAENRLERVPNVSNYQIYIERIDEMIARKEAGIQ
ncbi:MAG: coproporphyrinogen dehydrogenase HemZ [Clostridia bacterium]|nr:coproporphyrinogen dehydrogenase HemZ [Clostridia bacterium]